MYLVDACPYVFRAYFALPDTLTDPAGNPVNAVRGFADFLIRLIDAEEPTHLGVAFDKSLVTSFRNELYADYKAGRELPPPELEAQLAACEEVAAALGGAVFVDERYEADDLIATLCHRLKGEKTIVTNDKDLAQLVTDEVTLYDFARDQRYSPREVEEKFGVRPDQIADYLGLAGDSVDNIPGVKGVGAKTAVALLKAFDTVEGVYARLEEVADLPIRGAKGVRGKLEADEEMARLSKQLATVAIDAPVTATRKALRFRGADPGLVDPLFERLGLGGLRGRIGRWRE